MGFSVAISGGIVCVTIITVFSIVFAMTGQIYEINSSRTQSSELDNVLTHTNTNASYAYAQSRSDLVSLTFENIGNEKLWNYEKFNVLVTYNASIGGVPTLTTDSLTYNSAQAFAAAGANVGSSQFARPDEDVSKGEWVDTEGGDSDGILYEEINESVRSDLNYSSTKLLTTPAQTDTWEVGLQGPLEPPSSSNHIIRYVIRKTIASVSMDMTVRLLQGSTEIASWTDSLTNNFELKENPLTAGQADSITDYSDLRLRFTATHTAALVGRGEVSWAEYDLPSVPGTYNCSGVTLSSGQWTIDRITNDLQDPKILNTEEDSKICIRLSNDVYPNSDVTVTISTDTGKTKSAAHTA